MKKAFTMIELIFVIVIIGILAAVAIPRLTATRDDAKVAVCMADTTTLLTDLSSYYTSQGVLNTDITAMTNVELHVAIPIVADGSAGELYYACDNPTAITTNPALKIKFNKFANGDGNKMLALLVSAPNVLQGTVDGDLGFLLEKKNIVGTGGANHSYIISGIRTKR